MNQKDVYNCIIVEDDDLDRLIAASYIRSYPFLHLAGVFESAEEASGYIESNEVDVLFSDIDMPDINGIELRREWMKIPVCIFISSYPDYAAESFDVCAFDFIVKPLNDVRFDAAMKRCEEYFSIRKKADLLDFNLGEDIIFIKDGHKQIKLPLHQIIYLEALKDYTLVVTSQRKYSILSSIGNLLKGNNFQSFVRIHRSYAVQKHFIDSIAAQEVIVNNTKLPVGRSYKNNLNTIKN